jgi:hypothetical protein
VLGLQAKRPSAGCGTDDKGVLSVQVRSPFLPTQYPSSMKALYDSSPDECIADFFTNPQMLSAERDGMPPLSLPAWAPTVPAFLELHRCVVLLFHLSWHFHKRHSCHSASC